MAFAASVAAVAPVTMMVFAIPVVAVVIPVAIVAAVIPAVALITIARFLTWTIWRRHHTATE
jgi:hypothetical protein